VGDEIHFLNPRGFSLRREATQGQAHVFSLPILVTESEIGLVATRTLDYIDSQPPLIESVELDLQALGRREQVRAQILAHDDHDLSPRTLISLRHAQSEHLFYAFFCQQESGAKLVDVDPSPLPGGTYQVLAVAVDNAGNREERILGEVDLGARAGPSEFWLETLRASHPTGALYRQDLAEPVGEPLPWADSVPDPQGVFEGVAKLELRGYALGLEQAELKIELSVPEGADLLSIPLASSLNGAVGDTDSEAALQIEVLDPTSGQSSTTYATHIMDSELGAPYLYAFADISPFRGKRVSLTLTLLQPDVCSGSFCTHDIDLYIGPMRYAALPELCLLTDQGTYLIYDHPDDPTPTEVSQCEDPQPLTFLETERSAPEPFSGYGEGQDAYTLSLTLPETFELIDFSLQYGPRLGRMSINGQSIPPEAVHALFPVRRGTYNRVPSAARYSFMNHEVEALRGYFKPGENVLEFEILADQPWEERPFSLYLRFLTYEPEPQATPPPGPSPTPEKEDEPEVTPEGEEREGLGLPSCCTPGWLPWGALLGAVALLRTFTRRTDVE
jgi:hypothetical protein